MIDLLALLKRLEYANLYLDVPSCPECSVMEGDGPHRQSCQLAEAIRMLEGEWVRSGGPLICDVEEAKAAVSKIESLLNEPPDLPPIP